MMKKLFTLLMMVCLIGTVMAAGGSGAGAGSGGVASHGLTTGTTPSDWYGGGDTIQSQIQSQNQARKMTGQEVKTMVQSRVQTMQRERTQFQERVQKRSGFKRFFAGGDDDVAEELKNASGKNQLQIQQIVQDIQNCECDTPTLNELQLQLQEMQQEQTHLQEMEKKENRKGLLGWIWKWGN